MRKRIHVARFATEEAIRWRLSGESLHDRLCDTALNEAATDDNAASLTVEVFPEHGVLVVEVYVERDPVLACICGECAGADRYFKCGDCGHDTPWCRGADDQCPDLCDDCAVKESHERNL